jgi:hypothetical protein
MVPVPVPTFEKSYGSGNGSGSGSSSISKPYKANLKKKFGIFFNFLLSKLFYKEKVHEFQQIYGKM